MDRRRCTLVLILVASLAGSANADVRQDADAIADRYLAAMQRKGYAFLSKEELTRRRDQVAAFVVEHLRQPLDDATRAAMLNGIDRCIDRFYTSPAGKVSYGDGFGSGGEERMYLNDRDYFLTFQYHLWVSLTRQPLAPADLQRRDAQRAWMRAYLTNMPGRGIHEPLPREGMRHDEVRPWALSELEKAFADPMHLLSEPMPDDGFARLQDRFKQFSNGIYDDFHEMKVAALTSRFVSTKDPAGRFGYAYPGKLPFDDTVVDLWGNGPHLRFASNADFGGNHGGLGRSGVYDVIRCIGMQTNPAPAPGSPAMEAWLTTEGRGELALDGSTLIAVRGARFAELPGKTWFDVDKLSDDQLRAVLHDGGRDRISIKRLPPANGIHRDDRSEGEFFIVVENREKRLAVLNLHNYEFGQVMFWCRPREVRLK